MAIVTTFNGQQGTSSDDLFFHAFAGRPVDQYESPFADDDPRTHIGDIVVMTVRAELTAVVTDHISDGTRQSLKFKVVDSQPGKVIARSNGADPNQTSIDDADYTDDEDTDYGDYTDDNADGDGHDVSHDSPFTISTPPDDEPAA